MIKLMNAVTKDWEIEWDCYSKCKQLTIVQKTKRLIEKIYQKTYNFILKSLFQSDTTITREICKI